MPARHAGAWITRKVALAPDEEPLKSTGCVKFGPLGTYAIGLLTLTNERLIWTPSLFFWSPLVWSRTRSEIRSVSVHSRFVVDPWRSELRIVTADGTGKFGLDARFTSPTNAAAEWADAIKQWAAL